MGAKIPMDSSSLGGVAAADEEFASGWGPSDLLNITIPLKPTFRFVHEPIGPSLAERFLGRQSEIEQLVERILFSDGGSFLITGYRGVGKTSFVNMAMSRLENRLKRVTSILGPMVLITINISVSRPLSASELMHHIIRRLFEKLAETGLDRKMDPTFMIELSQAYRRTSFNMSRKEGHSKEAHLEIGDISPSHSPLKFAFGAKHGRSVDFEASFLGYEDKAAEHDVIRLSRMLAAGYFEKTWKARILKLAGVGKNSPKTRVKVVFVFDELDKLEPAVDVTAPLATPFLHQLLGSLKNVFTTSGICFVFVAGKDLQESLLEDCGRGDSIYESVFGYDHYLPCLWSHATEIFESIVDGRGTPAGDETQQSVLDEFKKYLTYKGRGIPRLVLRALNEYVHWTSDHPILILRPQDARKIRFYARLQETIIRNRLRLFGKAAEDLGGTLSDKRTLAVYYLIDWILRQGARVFTMPDLVSAANHISPSIVPAKEIAPTLVDDIITVLLASEYIQEIPLGINDTLIGARGESREKRFRLLSRRLVEMGRSEEDIERDSFAERYEGREKGLPTLKRYQLGRITGSGGMCDVYSGLDTFLNSQVAIKTLRKEYSNNPEMVARFKREMRILSSIHHPGVVQYLDSGEDNDCFYIVMELLDGVDLEDLIKTRGHLDVETAIEIATAAAEAIGYVHQKGYFRLDVKPSNVRITSAGRVCIFDFSIARESTSNLTRTGMVIGTLGYISPEQVTGQAADKRSDIYSFGVLLYRAVTGKLPFDKFNPTEMMQAHLLEGPPSPSQFVELPPELEQIILRCLEKHRDSRFQSMEEVSSALQMLAATPRSKVVLASVAGDALSQIRNAEAKEGEFTKMFKSVPEHKPQSVAWDALSQTRNAEAKAGEFTNLFKSVPEHKPQIELTNAVLRSDRYIDKDARLAGVAGAWLEFVIGPGVDASVFTLKKGENNIGRSSDNDLVLDDEKISRFHMRIIFDGGNYSLEDLNSANGTFINEARVTKKIPLRRNDRIQAGPFVMVFDNDQEP